MRSRKCIGLELVGFSLREASKISLFSTVAGGGLLGCGALDRRARTGAGAGRAAAFATAPLVAFGTAGAGI
jgi:hypothetical protein